MKERNIIDYAAAEQPLGCDSNLSSRFELMPGQLVRSIAGRDKGALYLIMAINNEGLLLVDGRKNAVTKPKRKNPRHVQRTHQVAADLVLIGAARPWRDEEVRAAINELTTKEGK